MYQKAKYQVVKHCILTINKKSDFDVFSFLGDNIVSLYILILVQHLSKYMKFIFLAVNHRWQHSDASSNLS